MTFLDRRRILAAVAISCTLGHGLVGEERPAKTTIQGFSTESIRGRVVWMADALQKRHGISVVQEAAQRVLALETADGELHPLVEDVRGRAFRSDPRLRQSDVELFVRRFRGSPFVQIINVFAWDKGRKYELDYWCDICAITMFEQKLCECCQGEIELRRREVQPSK